MTQGIWCGYGQMNGKLGFSHHVVIGRHLGGPMYKRHDNGIWRWQRNGLTVSRQGVCCVIDPPLA